MDFLKNLHPDERDNNIFLDEKIHQYHINGETNYTSVTTFVKNLFEPFNDELIIDNMMKSNNWKNNKYYGMTKSEIKELWKNNGDIKSKQGTQLHLDIEKFYNNYRVINNSPEFSYFLKFADKYKSLIPYRTEKIIYSQEFRLAGSIDMMFINSKENCLEIYDWKRVKDIVRNSKWNKWINNDLITYLPDSNYWYYALQLNIYKFIYNREYNFHVKNLYLVSLHPDNKSYQRIPVIDLQDEVKQLLMQRKSNLNNIKN